MATVLVRVDFDQTFKRNMDAMVRRTEDLRSLKDSVGELVRFGPGSVSEQFDQESEFRQNVRLRWPKTKPFGTKPAPAKTLQGSGALRAAWLGQGAGSILRNAGNMGFDVGVDTHVIPYAGVHHSLTPTVIRAKKRGKNGRLAMQTYLGMQYGVWISARKLLAGLVIPDRRVGIGEVMRSRFADLVARYILGEAVTRSDAGVYRRAA